MVKQLKNRCRIIQDAEWQGELDPEKNQLLFVRPQATLVGRENIGFLVAKIIVSYLGTVGTRELKDMGIAEQVLADYEAREEYQEVEDYLVKDGPICGYLLDVYIVKNTKSGLMQIKSKCD